MAVLALGIVLLLIAHIQIVHSKAISRAYSYVAGHSLIGFVLLNMIIVAGICELLWEGSVF